MLAATDGTGNLLWRTHYRPYGEKLVGGDGGLNREWYTGKTHDDDTGLDYFGARYYDAVAGRFLAMDPVDVKAEKLHSFNRYGYANNNPYRFVDPDGRSPEGAGDADKGGDSLGSHDRSFAGVTLASNSFRQDSAPKINLTTNQAKAQAEVNAARQHADERLLESIKLDVLKKDFFNSIKDSPKYPKSFRPLQNGTTKNTVNNKERLDQLREMESGKWSKVYKDGYAEDGSPISVHYFESASGKVYDVKVKSEWSNIKNK
ncbi:RHS repeat-associated core domain-containing protein [Chitinivorax sp. B]|uniref:RHS repeat-associated core domain-containing protein n=1 Tax=Chitinivorax sp. B TaxID=2502235 RepID=UPI0014852142|nr:RHS repeat-associated core domain-containing protein [Chitinivorax sp. B]